MTWSLPQHVESHIYAVLVVGLVVGFYLTDRGLSAVFICKAQRLLSFIYFTSVVGLFITHRFYQWSEPNTFTANLLIVYLVLEVHSR
jgi:hypothetical protein